ncbi:MAG: hypothetical protein HC899_35145 [Leptolyngbyaceae cyanobacterium SM1_4_3]|nr:hypothetical protein [Leptolyngbyaceae cyanobacterium SM1_4_3]
MSNPDESIASDATPQPSQPFREELNLIPLQSRTVRAIALPPNFPETTQFPRYPFGTRCRWIPNPSTDWGTIIGQVYAPVETVELSDSQWSWLYLLLLDADSPSRTWLVADWVEEDSLELLPVPDQPTSSEEAA